MSIRVLAVDDMKSVRNLLKTQLSLAGHEVGLAENGKQALEVARTFHPEVILLDVMMPEMDGMEACRRLREDPFTSDIYIIMLTAKDTTEDMVGGLDTGADDYMTKPFNPDELMARIRRGHKIYLERHDALFDALTGLFNRRSFDALFDKEISRSQRHGHDLTLVMVDIDHFKRVNDTHGHQTGDEVLRELARLLRESIRVSDLPCRWGGEEFGLLLLESDIDDAMRKAEEMRTTVEAHDFPGAGKLTASFGVACLRADDTAASLMERADKALYSAKETGRNRVVAGE